MGKHFSDEAQHNYSAELLVNSLERRLELRLDSFRVEDADDKPKAEILVDICDDLPKKLQEHIDLEYRDTTKAMGSLTFKSEKEKQSYWGSIIAGKVFELAVESQHYTSMANEYGEDLVSAERDRKLSQLMIAVAKNPRDFGLTALNENQRVPDGVFFTFNKETEQILVTRLAEAKAKESLDDRAIKQILKTGSRETIKLLVRELNNCISSGEFDPPKDRLIELITLLEGTRLNVTENLGIDIILPNNRKLPEVDVLKKGRTTENTNAYESHLATFRNLFSTENIDPLSLLPEITSDKIKFTKSIFDSEEIGKITDVIMETIDLNLEFPGEIISDSTKLETSEKFRTPEERIIHLIENSSDIQEYTKWLIQHLGIGQRSIKLGEEVYKNKSKMTVLTINEGSRFIHAQTGIFVDETGLDVKKSGPHALEKAVNAHLLDWYSYFEKLGISKETGASLTQAEKDIISGKITEIYENRNAG